MFLRFVTLSDVLRPAGYGRRIVLAALLCSLEAGCHPSMDGSLGSQEPAAAVGGVGGSAGRLEPEGAGSPVSPAAVGGVAKEEAAASAGPAVAVTSGSSSSATGVAAPPQPSASGAGADKPPLRAESSYREIIGSEWEVAPGENKIVCHRMTAAADLRINQFRTVQPPGTHHLGLYVSAAPDKPDGTIDCTLFEIGERMIVGAAPGSEAFSLPPGVANRIDQGSQLLLQLHLLNATDAPLVGRSVVEGVMLAQEEVKAEADVVTAQLLSLVVPPGETRAPGRCTFDRAQTLVAYGPHMHGTGRHAKLVLHRVSGLEQVLGERDFDFAEQRRYPLDLIEVRAGDYVEYECTYENSTGRTIYWGERVTDEMCLVNLYRFPAGGETLCFL